eukprot:2697372-Alexandrium_andersonii.AAC.1
MLGDSEHLEGPARNRAYGHPQGQRVARQGVAGEGAAAQAAAAPGIHSGTHAGVGTSNYGGIPACK